MAKKYKCRVEYLESTGTQWIDTGIAPSSITPIAKLKFTPTQYYASGSYGIFGCFGADNTRFQIFFNSIGIGTYVSKTWPVNTAYEVELNGKTPSATVNGTVETSGYSNANGFSSYNMYLFTRNNVDVADAGVPLKLYYCKIWDNEVLVRDFIPVLDLSGKPAMYDQVSGKLFYNQGTGEFTYGRQIIPVEYLENTGTQYIDTGLNPTDDYGYKIKNTYTYGAGEQCAIGCMDSNNRFVGVYTGGGAYVSFGWGSFVGYIGTHEWDTDTVWDVYCNYKNDRKVILNGIEYKDLTDTHLTGVVSNTLYIGARHYGSSPTKMRGKIYGVEITNGTEVIANYIPAMDENHVPFMFDLVTNTCYLNAGTGQFKFGPNVEKMWGGKKLRRKLALALANLKKKRRYYCEVEYLQSTGTQYIDTGIAGSSTLKIEMNGQKAGADYGVYFGAGTGNNRIQAIYVSNYNSARLGNVTTNLGPDTEKFNVVVDTLNKNVIYNGTSYPFTYTSALTNLNIFIFTRNEGTSLADKATAKCWSFKIYDNNILVRDFIPVLDWNMRPCMFDRVTEQLFYNQGTGDFISGRQIHPVDYLESTGTQYIDTGIVGTNENMGIDVTWAFSNNDENMCIFSSRSAQTSNSFTLFWLKTASNRIRFDTTGQPYFANGVNASVSDDIFNFNYKSAEGAIATLTNKTTEQIQTLNTGKLTTFSTNNLYLFASRDTGTVGSWIKMYNCQIYDSNTLVRDYVPMVDEQGVGAMFDIVTHTIYDNAGTGDGFNYPPVELEYIECVVSGTNKPYINTGVYATENTRILAKLYTTDTGNKNYFGGNANGSSSAADGFVFNSMSTTQLEYLFGKGSGWKRANATNIVGTPFELDFSKSGVIVDGSVIDVPTYTSFPTQTLTVTLFVRNSGSAFINGRVYYFKMYENGTLVRDLIPCYKDGVACMVDKLTGTVYLNQGTGAFVAGSVKEPEYE